MLAEDFLFQARKPSDPRLLAPDSSQAKRAFFTTGPEIDLDDFSQITGYAAYRALK